MNDNKLEKTIQRLVASNSNEEAKEIYAAWQSYDSDLDEYGYLAPQTAASRLINLISDKDALIYDAGCGTGKVGVLLQQAEFKHIEGGDLSESMLERAKARNVYQKLMIADFSTRIEEADQYYDAVISVGVWSEGFGDNFTREMVRLVKPEGYIVFSVRPHYMPALQLVLDKLSAECLATVLSNELSDYITGQNSQAHFITLQRAGS